MKKLSTVLLALSMLFGSDVDARRARDVKAEKKGIKANKSGKDVEFSAENLVEKVLELSSGDKNQLDDLGNVAKTLSKMVEKNPDILKQVQDIVRNIETVTTKSKKGKRKITKKSASELALALGKLTSVNNPIDSLADLFSKVAKAVGLQDEESFKEMQAALKKIFDDSVKTGVNAEEQVDVDQAKVTLNRIGIKLSKALNLGANVKEEDRVRSFEDVVESLGGKYVGYKFVDTATAKNAPAKFENLLKSSKLIANDKKGNLNTKFNESFKFNSEKLVKDLNVALTEKDETKKFDLLKALFASLDPQYETLIAPVLSDADVVSKVQSLYLQDPKFQGTAKLADLNAVVEDFRAAYVAASDVVKGNMCAGLKTLEAEKVDSDKITARVEHLRDHGTYTSSDAKASASVYSVIKKLFDQNTADLYKNSLKASKGTITEVQAKEFNDFVASLQGCVEDVVDNMGDKTGLRLSTDIANALTSDERATLYSFIKDKDSAFRDMCQEFSAAMATFAVSGYKEDHLRARAADLGKLDPNKSFWATEIKNLKDTFGIFGPISTKSKKTKDGEYKLGDMLVGNTTVIELIKRCSATPANGGLDIAALKEEQAVKDHFQNRTNKINQFAANLQQWMRDLEIFPAQSAHADVPRAVQDSRKMGGDLFARVDDENNLARQTLVSIFDNVIAKGNKAALLNGGFLLGGGGRAGCPAVTDEQYNTAVKKTRALLDIIRGK